VHGHNDTELRLASRCGHIRQYQAPSAIRLRAAPKGGNGVGLAGPVLMRQRALRPLKVHRGCLGSPAIAKPQH
jgi:hypothetical protein